MAICTQSMYAKIRVESQAISENTRGQDLRSSFYLYRFNVDCPEARRVICISMKTTIYSSENAHTE